MTEERKLDLEAEDLDLDESDNLVIKKLDQDTLEKLRGQLVAARQDGAVSPSVKFRVTVGV